MGAASVKTVVSSRSLLKELRLERPTLLNTRRLQQITDFTFALLVLLTIIAAVVSLRTRNSYVVSDWLINYEGGFVRRGFSGELIYFISKLFRLQPHIIVLAFCLTAGTTFVVSVRRLFKECPPNFWLYAMVGSPAFLSFHILHANSGFRKELVFLILLSLLASRNIFSLFSSAQLACILGIVLVSLVLSHEAMVLYVPYIFAAVLIQTGSWSRSLSVCAGSFLLAATAAHLCALFPGDRHAAHAICASLGNDLPVSKDGYCGGGAIGYLAKTSAASHLQTLSDIKRYGYWRLYPLFAGLSLIPLIGLSLEWSKAGLGRYVKLIWFFGAAALFLTMTLFAYAVDWGRWIYIHIACISILLLLVGSKLRAEQRFPRPKSRVRRPIALKLVLLGAYCLLWAMPGNLDGSSIRLGYLGRLYDFVERGSRVTNAVVDGSSRTTASHGDPNIR